MIAGVLPELWRRWLVIAGGSCDTPARQADDGPESEGSAALPGARPPESEPLPRIYNGIVAINFSCDGSDYMRWNELLAEEWMQGQPALLRVTLGTPFVEVIQAVQPDGHNLVIKPARQRPRQPRALRQHRHAPAAQVPLPSVDRP